jgi:TetR/AcrR family transcriptional repressor of nem operon
MLVMPWPKGYKRNTRERIVEAAAAAFRQNGIAAVGVADVMRQAGLTHGGFYAHFESKDDLVTAALGHASAQAHTMLERSVQDDGAADRLLSAAMTYLSSAHLAHPEWGCPVAALGPELMRGSQKVRRTLVTDIRQRLKKLNGLIPPAVPPETRRRQVAGTLACMIGGLILARGLNESEGRELLDDCRGFLREALANSDAATATRNRRRKPAIGKG